MRSGIGASRGARKSIGAVERKGIGAVERKGIGAVEQRPRAIRPAYEMAPDGLTLTQFLSPKPLCAFAMTYEGRCRHLILQKNECGRSNFILIRADA